LDRVVELKEADIRAFEVRIGYQFRERSFLLRALTHKSYSHEARGGYGHNETFEFLGDSVLGFVVGDEIFRRFPDMDEGALSKMKAYLVSAPILARKARDLGMGEMLLLGVGELRSGGRQKESLLANLFEAVLAGVYLDGGVEPARDLILRALDDDLRRIDSKDLLFQDYKTALQEIAQGLAKPLPVYTVIRETGPDHDKRFVVEVVLDDMFRAVGEGSSKKEAQQQAAKEALEAWRKGQESG
jgi:ribonuclease-3